MARYLPSAAHTSNHIQQAVLAVIGLCFCAFTLFMCASHSRRFRRWRSCYAFREDEPVIQINNEGMILGSREDQDVSVWQKNILMGGKCQLPDFSGVIIYDSAGNVVTSKPSRLALPWKGDLRCSGF